MQVELARRNEERQNELTNYGEFATTAQLVDQMGPDAAAILNKSHCRLEDRLALADEMIEVYDQFFYDSVRFTEALKPHAARYEAMENLLLDTERLKEYYIKLRLNEEGEMEQQQPQQQYQEQYVQGAPPEYYERVEQPQGHQVQRAAFPAPPQMVRQEEPRFDDVRPDLRWLILDRMENERMIGQERL